MRVDRRSAVAAKEKKLEMLLLGMPVSEQTRATVLQQLRRCGGEQQAARNFPIKAMDTEMMAGAVPGGSMANQRGRAGGSGAEISRQR